MIDRGGFGDDELGEIDWENKNDKELEVLITNRNYHKKETDPEYFD